MIVERYTPERARDWDDLVGRSRTRHFLFRRGYMDYHADRFTDWSMMLVDEGKGLLGVLPANRSGDEVVSHGGLTFGGVLSVEAMSATRMLEAFDAMLDVLRADGVNRFVYKPVPHIYHSVPAEEDLYALFRQDARLIRRDVSSTIRLDKRLRYSKGRRAKIKAARELTVEPSDDFATFIALEQQTLERHGVTPVHTGDELALLAGRFPDNIRLRIALRDGELLAGVVVYITPEVVHAQYIASTLEGREAGAVDAVVDRLIAEAGEAGRRWFDFGISTTEQGRNLNQGLVRNKESYGARATVYEWYELLL